MASSPNVLVSPSHMHGEAPAHYQKALPEQSLTIAFFGTSLACDRPARIKECETKFSSKLLLKHLNVIMHGLSCSRIVARVKDASKDRLLLRTSSILTRGLCTLRWRTLRFYEKTILVESRAWSFAHMNAVQSESRSINMLCLRSSLPAFSQAFS